MNAKTVRIIDIGRGPQIEGHRLTVMDGFRSRKRFQWRATYAAGL